VKDKLVKPLYERQDGSAPGPFYVVKDQCITCSLPTDLAPENIRYHQRPAQAAARRSSTIASSSGSPKPLRRLTG
jgi:hypothetical protein